MATVASRIGKHRILLVDDHPIVRQGLAEMIDQERDLQVAGTAEDVHKALEALEKMRPDLVIADISLKGSNGIELNECILDELAPGEPPGRLEPHGIVFRRGGELRTNLRFALRRGLRGIDE